MNKSSILDIKDILAILPHRYPFLLVDKIIDLQVGAGIVGIKNVTFNEPHFAGHFPAMPVMPGVMIIEAMAQVSAILVAKSLENISPGNIPYLVGIDRARFRKSVVPGDVLELSASVARSKSGIWILDALAKVEGGVVAEASIMATFKVN